MSQERTAAIREQLDTETDTPFLSSDEIVVVEEPPAHPRPAVTGQLVHQRHDSSMLFSTTTFAEIAMTAMRGFAATQASALVTVPPRATRAPQASATFVPIALPQTAASRRDKWLWRSLTIATAALLFFFVAALDLLIRRI
jgi:hypothetical protein